MPFYAIFLLAVIQGLTEFLPISSQAHLILVPSFLGWEEHGRFLDVAIHLGTFLAVFAYFYKDLWILFTKGALPFLKGKITPDGRLVLYLIYATLPCIIVGYGIHVAFGDGLRGVSLIAWSSIIFGSLLYLIDQKYPQSKTLENLTWRDAFFIGCAQILSFFPGASRSGTTITAGRFLGFSRVEATRFSFLLSLPVVLGAIVLTGTSAFKEHGFFLFNTTLLWGIVFSFLSGMIVISFLVKWLKHHSYAPFMIYRILLGVGLLIWQFLRA